MLKSSDFEEPSEDSLINLTPLIDVVFVVLIAFIIVAPMLEVDQVTLAKAGKKEHATATDSGKIIITVKDDNSVFLNKEKVLLADLGKKLQIIKKQFPKENPRLFHDKNAAFGTYQAIKNMVEEADFAELDVVLNP